MLSDFISVNNSVVINFGSPRRINSIGIGNVDGEEFAVYDGWKADAVYNDNIDGGKADTIFSNILSTTRFTIIFNDIRNTVFSFNYDKSGLYVMPGEVIASKIIINTNAKTVGRIGAGMAVNIPTAIPKEPAFCSTAEPRMTLSGQVVHGAGGYNYRIISLDSRYKIDSFAINELIEGKKYIGMGYPFFIDLTNESYKLPFNKFYGIDSNQQKISFESGIKKYLYSRRFEFRECF